MTQERLVATEDSSRLCSEVISGGHVYLCPLQENDCEWQECQGEMTGFLSRRGSPLWVLELGRGPSSWQVWGGPGSGSCGGEWGRDLIWDGRAHQQFSENRETQIFIL